MKLSSDDQIKARIRSGKGVIRSYSESDQLYSARFLDPTSETATTDPSVFTIDNDTLGWNSDVAEGVPNTFMINVNTKVSAICVNDPDFRVLSEDNDVPHVMRQWLRQIWKTQDVSRTSVRTAQKWMISGLGICRYMWDSEARCPDAEFVQSWHFFHDPNAKSWRRLKWAGCVVVMAKEEAKEFYGTDEFNVDPDAGDSDTVNIDIYWDMTTEAHVCNGKVLKKTENLYGRPPFLFLEGDPNPNQSRYPIGDGRVTAGVCKMISNLYQMMANTAINGGPITFVNTNLLDSAAEKGLHEAIEQGVVPVRDNPDNVYRRVGSEPLAPALLEGLASMQRAIDASMGVTAFQRGQSVEGTTTATETMAMVQQSGSRGVEARVKFERFLDELANTFVYLQLLFGGPNDEVQDQHPMETIVWHAAGMTDEVHVVEGSTVFRDPNMDQQQAMTLFNLAIQATPVMAQSVGKMPDLARLWQDVLTSFGRRDASVYVVDVPQAPAPEQGMQGLPPEMMGGGEQMGQEPMMPMEGTNGGV